MKNPPLAQFTRCSAALRAILVTLSLGAALQLATAAKANTFTLHFENDTFGGTDRYYTHATLLEYGFDSGKEPGWLSRLGGSVGAESSQRRYALRLGQYLYTPSDIRPTNPSPSDRPYGAWLFIGAAQTLVHSPRMADFYVLSAGMVGPAAGGRFTQTTFHRWRGAQKPMGWSTQLPNEPALNLWYERRWKMKKAADRGFGWEFIPYAGFSAGNVFLFAHSGATARAGFNLPDDFSFKTISPSVVGLDRRPPKFGFYGFATVEARAVAHNIFVQGSLFQDSRGTDGEPVVADLTSGLAVQLGRRWEATYAYVIRGREFKAQRSDQKFGSVRLSYRW